MITLYDMMCSKDFFNATAKAVLKKEDGNFQFGKANKDYYWLITNMYDATLEIDLIERDKSILMHVNKNHKSGKNMKFPLTDDFEEDYDEMLDYIFRFLMNEFGVEWYESKKSAHKYLTEGLRYDTLTLELIQDDIELYFEDKGYDVKIIDSGKTKALNVLYIYICKGKDFNKIKSDDLYDFLYSDVINSLLYHNDDFNVIVKNKQIMIILPKTRDYTE